MLLKGRNSRAGHSGPSGDPSRFRVGPTTDDSGCRSLVGEQGWGVSGSPTRPSSWGRTGERTPLSQPTNPSNLVTGFVLLSPQKSSGTTLYLLSRGDPRILRSSRGRQEAPCMHPNVDDGTGRLPRHDYPTGTCDYH